MAKYLFEVDYTDEGSRGLIKDGGTKRKANAEKMAKDLGGKIEAFYFTFGTRDAIVIAEIPDTATALAISLAISASGAMRFRTTPLISPAEMDQAAKKHVDYKAPGQK